MSTRSLLHWVAIVAGAEGLARGYLSDRPDWFHAGAWLLAAALAWAAWQLRSRRRGTAAVLALAATLPALLSLLSLVTPADDADPPDPRLALWQAHEPERRLLEEGIRAPADQVELFGVAIALGPGGTRARAGITARGPRYRVAAVGGSSTFGATRQADERPWPALLEAAIRRELSCELPVEVVNAGVLGLGIAGVVKSFDAQILPLDPQLLIYESGAHELDELAAQVPELQLGPFEPTPARASALLRRIERRWRRRADARDWREAAARVPDREPRETLLAGAYRHLLLDARRHGIEVVIAGLTLALPRDAPADSIRRMEALDARTRQRLLALDLHRRVLRELAATYRATLLEPRPEPALEREALFLDLALRSQLGRERLAEQLLETLRPQLSRPTPGCRPRTPGRV